MDKIDILLWVMGGGFTLMLVMWHNLGKRIDDNGGKIAEIDKRLYGIETVLHMKDCCVLKQDQVLKKAE